MKIAVITNLFPPHYVGGFEIRCEQVSRALAARGHEVVVLTSVNGVDQPVVESGEIAVHRIFDLYRQFTNPVTKETYPWLLVRSDRWKTTVKNYRIAQEVLRREQPDLVFAWSQSHLSLGPVRAAQDLRIPLAWTFGDPNINQYKPAPFSLRRKKLLRYIQDRWLWRGTTWVGLDFSHTHCVSLDIKRRLVEQGLPIENSQVIYRGIPIEQFPMRENPGSLHQPIRLLFVGQVHSYKGVHTLVEAAHRLAGRYGAGHLVVSIVGEGVGEYKRTLVEQAESGPAEVVFRGKLPHKDLSVLYREHDIFVFPSAGGGYEGFGATALEAMASGLPVVGTTQGGMAELFVHEGNALVFEAEQPVDLADKLERMIRDDDLRRRLVLTARRQMESNFAIQDYANKMEQFVLGAAARRLEHNVC
ncbi:MAG: glycosyltransferase family 4 protein [Gammaproteobacteria bacterium]|nr:glycosyltransferase family 4 protein [Gammaproteobacteria bacterium]